ncbi:MAG: hypothetical protein QM527_07805 [Alphaproteobacteria bacterium]|nr:hypothetical protein [Alphaproteobacteria bacterium]
MTQPSHARHVLQMMATLDLQTLSRKLPQLSLPVQMQIGLADGTVPPSLADQAQHLLPQVERLDWPELGHLAHEEAPQVCADAVLRFCAA